MFAILSDTFGLYQRPQEKEADPDPSSFRDFRFKFEGFDARSCPKTAVTLAAIEDETIAFEVRGFLGGATLMDQLKLQAEELLGTNLVQMEVRKRVYGREDDDLRTSDVLFIRVQNMAREDRRDAQKQLFGFLLDQPDADESINVKIQ